MNSNWVCFHQEYFEGTLLVYSDISERPKLVEHPSFLLYLLQFDLQIN